MVRPSIAREKHMLVVGSQALRAHGVKIGSKPSDLDIIASSREISEWQESQKGFIKNTRKIDDKKCVFFMTNGDIVEFEIASEDKNPTAVWLLLNYSGLGYPRVVTEG